MGDADLVLGDARRGFVTYAPGQDALELRVNPGAERFVAVDAADAAGFLREGASASKKRRDAVAPELAELEGRVRGKYVMLRGVEAVLDGAGGASTVALNRRGEPTR